MTQHKAEKDGCGRGEGTEKDGCGRGEGTEKGRCGRGEGRCVCKYQLKDYTVLVNGVLESTYSP